MQSTLYTIIIVILQIVICLLWLLPYVSTISMYIIRDKFTNNENTDILTSCLIESIRTGKITPQCEKQIFEIISGDTFTSKFTNVNDMSSILSNNLQTDSMMTKSIKMIQDNSVSVFSEILNVFSKISHGIYHIFSNLFDFIKIIFLFFETNVKLLLMVFIFIFNLFDFVVNTMNAAWKGMIAFGGSFMISIFTMPIGAVIIGFGVVVKKLHGFMKSIHTPLQAKINEITRDF